MAAEVLNIVDLRRCIGARQRLIGVDLGTKTIGLALSDVERSIATPLETIRRTKFMQGRGSGGALANQFDVAALVIGLPLNMDGQKAPACRRPAPSSAILDPFRRAPSSIGMNGFRPPPSPAR